MSAPPPEPGQPQVPDPGAILCPRCTSPVGADQDWCLECGAPARTRLAQTPNWRLPTVAITAIVAIAGALLAFAFVELTSDDGAIPASTVPTAAAPVAPAPVATAPVTVPATATATTPATATVPSATTTLPAPTTTTPATGPPPRVITATTSQGVVTVTTGR